MFFDLDRAGSLPPVAIREPAVPQGECKGDNALKVSGNRIEDSDSESDDEIDSVGDVNAQASLVHRKGTICFCSFSEPVR